LAQYAPPNAVARPSQLASTVHCGAQTALAPGSPMHNRPLAQEKRSPAQFSPAFLLPNFWQMPLSPPHLLQA